MPWSCAAHSMRAYRQFGHVAFLSSHPARHSPQNECPAQSQPLALTFRVDRARISKIYLLYPHKHQQSHLHRKPAPSALCHLHTEQDTLLDLHKEARTEGNH